MDNSKEYWMRFYKEKELTHEPSSFALDIYHLIEGDLIDIGCGNKRDTDFFKAHYINAIGIDQADGVDVGEYIKEYPSPDNVYARFFWHSIDRATQIAILKWTKKNIYIEARTTDDKALFKEAEPHERNYVDVALLVVDLKRNGFEIVKLEEGTGFSPYKNEDPHLVRVIAQRGEHRFHV